MSVVILFSYFSRLSFVAMHLSNVLAYPIRWIRKNTVQVEIGLHSNRNRIEIKTFDNEFHEKNTQCGLTALAFRRLFKCINALIRKQNHLSDVFHATLVSNKIL